MLAASETRTRRLQAITAEIDAAMFNDHPEVQALKARIAEAKAAHDAAAAEAKEAKEAPQVSGAAIERTSRALREQIAERERGLESLALEALLAGDLEGATYAAAQAELQAVRWQLEGLELGYKLLLRTPGRRARGLAQCGADPVRAARRRVDSLGTQLGELLATLAGAEAEKRLAQQDEENAAARAAGKPRPHPEHVGANLASRFRKTGAPERNRLGRPI